jgi:hypothetical protein
METPFLKLENLWGSCLPGLGSMEMDHRKSHSVRLDQDTGLLGLLLPGVLGGRLHCLPASLQCIAQESGSSEPRVAVGSMFPTPSSISGVLHSSVISLLCS